MWISSYVEKIKQWEAIKSEISTHRLQYILSLKPIHNMQSQVIDEYSLNNFHLLYPKLSLLSHWYFIQHSFWYLMKFVILLSTNNSKMGTRFSKPFWKKAIFEFGCHSCKQRIIPLGKRRNTTHIIWRETWFTLCLQQSLQCYKLKWISFSIFSWKK